MSKRVVSMGIDCPIVKEGDDIVDVVVKSVLKQTTINKNDIIAITESVVARTAGLYVTVDDIANDIRKKFGENPTLTLLFPIYSRNRFSLILKGFARASKEIICIMPDFDEVGNPVGVNPFTGVDIKEFYKSICSQENCKFSVEKELHFSNDYKDANVIDCRLHTQKSYGLYTLADICADKNPDFGLLGTNKATEEKLKLFPTKELADKVCSAVKNRIKTETGEDVIVMVYGDGCFKSPNLDGVLGSSIWEFADPTSFLTSKEDYELLNSCPNEIKVKYLADNEFADLSGDSLTSAIKGAVASIKDDLKGTMTQQGCTPRRYGDLIASLCDLTSGSGSRMTPVIFVNNYF